MSERKKCADKCPCICHDTGGADYGMHGDNGRCPSKDDKPLVALEVQWVVR